MKECLDYIKQSGEEIKELNLKIQSEINENKKLRDQISYLQSEVAQKNYELKDARKLANRWWREFDNLSIKYDNLESVTDAMSVALAKIAPALYDEINEDIQKVKNNQYSWNDVITDFKRDRW